MEQKHEEIKEPDGPKSSMWLPWLNLENADPRNPLPAQPNVSTETTETPPLVPPLPSLTLAAPSYYAPTELNLRLSQMGRETPARELGLVGFWACLVPVLSILTLVSIVSGTPVGALGSGTALAFLLHNNRLVDKLNQANAALALSGYGKEWIGGLIEALLWPNARIQGIASLALTQLLPRLTAEDAGLLTPQQREILYTRLHYGRSSAEFRIAILKALALIGDEHSVLHLECRANDVAWTPKQAQVRTAAREALTVVMERLAKQKEAATTRLTPIEDAAPIVQEAVQTDQQRSKEAEELLQKMDEESRNRNQPAMRLGFLIANWAIIVPYLGSMTVGSMVSGAPWGATLVWASMCLGSTQLYRFTLTRGQSETARRLAHTEDIRAVGPLAEALEWPDRDIQFAACKGLTRLLPRLRATDSALLNQRQRHILYKSLKMNKYTTLKREEAQRDEELILAILTALEQVGDRDAIQYVERLAHHAPLYPREKRIRDRAEQCYPYLLSRADANANSMMLLRASSASEMSPEILLRPASQPHVEAAEELLRPSADEN